ncbi:hypothetical protein [uncultured Methanobrevibacter sp.]|uniref:hypothetical protein n=1 Tax=uncultured Methanobrevibacter sp. TaxID=253161 RepID=UPI0025E3F8B7|nr:hypothetical protein [uncultured Methanobrevibacter sp.]
MKKILSILVFAAVFGLLIGSVAASSIEMVSHDFDGNFDMNVPKNATFKKVDSSGFLESTVAYYDAGDNLNVTYTLQDVNDTVKNAMSQLSKLGVNFTTDGDIKYASVGNMSEILYQKNGELVILSSDKLDMNTLKEMAHSIKLV